MRIHTRTLVEQDFRDAAKAAGPNVRVHHISKHGSRSRGTAFDVVFEGSSNHGGQFGQTDYAAACWDEWGIALGVIFGRDPEARIAGIYEGVEDFHWQTANRFEALTPPFVHLRHRWEHQGVSPGGVYTMHACDCGAYTRRLLGGRTWDEFQHAYA